MSPCSSMSSLMSSIGKYPSVSGSPSQIGWLGVLRSCAVILQIFGALNFWWRAIAESSM